ncbi:myotubularin-related protein 8 isoform X1 [Tenebrio molitor]|jgi:myotubularin-related protein 6/7/8|uniref:myotubularin-related protein 8 isoform X1 n=2 Tax=Tenebrio molitor TaxID=7067 RepID=UPI0036249DFC
MELIKTPKVENVRMLDRFCKTPSLGTLYLTATHLIFVDPDAKKETWILHMHIANTEKLPLTTTGSPLLIRTKTFLSVTFVIPKERDCHDIYITLQQLSQPSNVEELYCFTYTSPVEEMPKSLGWDFFNLQAEYERQGVPNEQWCLTKLNSDYDLCETYPKYLIVPASANITTLMGSSKFRSKGRLPVLSYLHHNKASISRCSQPLSGFSARCLEDEKMLNHVLRTNPNANYMFVVDTRPKINAMANRAAGKGYENEAFYENIKFQFLGVENIHVMRNSLTKVIETCEQKNPTMNSFLSGLESSGWLRHIKSILDTSWFIAQAVDDGINVVVHCSDGWDRTAQVCFLAALLLDPYYRTITGFQALIEKDWLAFGHKFSERCGHIQGDSREISPVFTQLLDCTWQLMQQFPLAFQFNEKFLLTLHDHVHSCQYGTFIGNSEKEKIELKLAQKTYSLWGYMANYLNEYENPLYDPADFSGVLVPILAPQKITFWRGMYCRFESGVHPREPQTDLLSATVNHTHSLDDHIKYLSKRISSMKSFIAKAVENKFNKLNDSRSRNAPTDNRYFYEKTKELEASDHDHPLKASPEARVDDLSPSKSGQNLSKDLDSVALDWKSLRNTNECICSSYFDQCSQKTHCRRCGNIFCMRCITKKTVLPGYLNQQNVSVCKPCYEILVNSTETSD